MVIAWGRVVEDIAGGEEEASGGAKDDGREGQGRGGLGGEEEEGKRASLEGVC